MLERLLTDPKFGVKCEFGWQAYDVIAWFEKQGYRYTYTTSDPHRQRKWNNSIVCMFESTTVKECIPWILHQKVHEYISYDEFYELINTENVDVPFPENLI